MAMKKNILFFILCFPGFLYLQGQNQNKTVQKLNLSEQEWAKKLSPQQYQVLRACGTEPPFTGKYVFNKKSGNYYCAACGALLFSSETKYDSGSGWPSFYAPANNKNIVEMPDTSHGMHRIEIRCARCGSHLGHVFSDGPLPTGLRYCVNSLALEFKETPAKKQKNHP